MSLLTFLMNNNYYEFLGVWKEHPVSYNKRDLLLYALGIGCNEPRFVYENDSNFAPFPTYPAVLSFKEMEQDVVTFPPQYMQDLDLKLDGTRVSCFMLYFCHIFCSQKLLVWNGWRTIH